MVAHTYEPNMNNLFGSTLITSYTEYNTTFVTKIYNESMYMSMCIIKCMGKIIEVGQQNHGDSCGTRKRLLSLHTSKVFSSFFLLPKSSV